MGKPTDDDDGRALDSADYKALFKPMPQGMAYCVLLEDREGGVDWRYLAVNPAFLRATAMPDPSGRRASEVQPNLAATEAALARCFARVAKGGLAEQWELFLAAFDAWFEVTVHAPAARHFVLTLNPISERKRSQQAVAESEEVLRLAVEGANLGTWRWNLTDDSAYYSERSAGLFGLPAGQALDRALSFRMIHRDDRALVASVIEYALAQRSHCEFEFRAVWPDGSSHWLTSRGHGTYAEDGRPLRMNGVMWDIDARKRAEQDLHRSEQRFHGLFDCMREGFMILDAMCDGSAARRDWRVVEVNPSGCAQVGVNRNRMIGQSVRDVFPALEEGWFVACARAESGVGAMRYRGYYAAVQRHFDVHFYAMKPGQVACVFTDITLQLRAESEHQRLEAQFMRAQKMEAIGQLTGGIAHNFNNILTGVLGYAKLALSNKDLDADSKVRKYLGEVLSGAERAAELVDKMQIFSRGPRGGSGEVAQTSRADIEEIVHMLRAALPASIDLEQQLEESAELPLSPADMHQLLINLVVNARDAIFEVRATGRVVVSLRAARTLTAVCSDCRASFSAPFAELAVSDDGSGMSPERAEMIFDPFFTSKEVGKGTGLGLSVVRGIVHDAGGHILVETVPLVGTVMRLLFPL